MDQDNQQNTNNQTQGSISGGLPPMSGEAKTTPPAAPSSTPPSTATPQDVPPIENESPVTPPQNTETSTPAPSDMAGEKKMEDLGQLPPLEVAEDDTFGGEKEEKKDLPPLPVDGGQVKEDGKDLEKVKEMSEVNDGGETPPPPTPEVKPVAPGEEGKDLGKMKNEKKVEDLAGEKVDSGVKGGKKKVSKKLVGAMMALLLLVGVPLMAWNLGLFSGDLRERAAFVLDSGTGCNSDSDCSGTNIKCRNGTCVYVAPTKAPTKAPTSAPTRRPTRNTTSSSSGGDTSCLTAGERCDQGGECCDGFTCTGPYGVGTWPICTKSSFDDDEELITCAESGGECVRVTVKDSYLANGATSIDAYCETGYTCLNTGDVPDGFERGITSGDDKSVFDCTTDRDCDEGEVCNKETGNCVTECPGECVRVTVKDSYLANGAMSIYGYCETGYTCLNTGDVPDGFERGITSGDDGSGGGGSGGDIVEAEDSTTTKSGGSLVCSEIKIYTLRDGVWTETALSQVGSYAGVGDTVRFALKGTGRTAVRGQFNVIVHGVDDEGWIETNTKNGAGELYIDYVLNSAGDYVVIGEVQDD